ncbi:glycosyltransferase [Paenibacillus sp.]|uniref:glycosyltransferase n=1 Tax=Paenibacillus sp. TaxID=58172 RepID=UPI002810BAA1|nr:glycosyltransferase [Paenibacillus sp.]
MKEQAFVSLIMYLHNQESQVEGTLRAIDYFFASSFENYEIIIVDDYSTDQSLSVAQSVAQKMISHVTIVNLSRKHGVEQAMFAGLNKSIGDFVFEIDNFDLTFPADVLMKIYKKALQGYDIVSASSKQLSTKSKLFYKLINKLSYLQLDLSTEVARVVSRRALNAMLNLKEKVRYRKALYAFTGYPSTKLVVETTGVRPRSWNRENVSLALDVIVSFSNIGLKAAHYMSLLFFLFSIVMIVYSLYNFIFNKNIVEGWTTLMILISTGFAGMFFIFGMLGEYLSRMLIELQDRPSYSVRSVQMFKEASPEIKHEVMVSHSEAAATKV